MFASVQGVVADPLGRAILNSVIEVHNDGFREP